MKANLFTVVIAKKKHIDSIEDYALFLRPLMNRDQVVFCPWDTEAASPGEAVPDLAEAVGRHERWRAVIVADEAGLERKNPFDLTPYTPPARGSLTAEEYRTLLHEAKKTAYDAAAGLPLAQLAAQLCEEPLTSAGNNHMSDEPEYAEYLWEAEYKHQLRTQITGGKTGEITLPTEICCIAMRCCNEPAYDINVSWKPGVGVTYSRFYDWNLYFDKMRYLVFDILPKKHQDYVYSYIRFLYALLILAGNETPPNALLPFRLYRLECENDECAMRRLLVSYDDKLGATEDRIREEIGKLERETKRLFTDNEADQIFGGSVAVPVVMEQSIDPSPLFVNVRHVGLAGDCPGSEENRWDTAYRRTEHALRKLAKQPQRSLTRAIDIFHQMDCADTDSAMQLNEFQVDDIREHIDDAELGILGTKTRDISDLSGFRRRMEVEDKAIRKEIGTRMKRRTVIGLGAAVIILYLACYLPLLMKNALSFGAVFGALLLIGAAAALMILVGIGCMFALRGRLVWKLKRFNSVMGSIYNDLDSCLDGYSRYLSGACTMQRGASVINYLNEHEDTGLLRVRVRRKHLYDIAARRAEMRDVFGCFLTDRSFSDPNLSVAYKYDFDRPVCFPYPMPFTDGERRPITYLRTGHQITIPVDFVKKMTVRMEELYD